MTKTEKYHQNMTNVFNRPSQNADANIKRHLENLEKSKSEKVEKVEEVELEKTINEEED